MWFYDKDMSSLSKSFAPPIWSWKTFASILFRITDKYCEVQCMDVYISFRGTWILMSMHTLISSSLNSGLELSRVAKNVGTSSFIMFFTLSHSSLVTSSKWWEYFS